MFHLSQPIIDVMLTLCALAVLVVLLEVERRAERLQREMRSRHPSTVHQSSCVRLLRPPAVPEYELDS